MNQNVLSAVRVLSGRVLPITLMLVLVFASALRAQNLNPNPLPIPTLPTINTANSFNITAFGAVSSPTAANTTAIQNTINAAAAASGGGTVEIPAGTYLSGPLTMKSLVNLQIDSGATLMMLPKSSWSGSTFINGSSIHDVEISGSGTIDGNAHFGATEWWGVETTGTAASSRPAMINFSGCSRILIQDVTLQNPPTFHVVIKGNNINVTVQRITMNTPGDSPNTDAFDIGSTNVLIQNSSINVGDDDAEIGGSQTAAYVTITNCAFGSGHGVSIGSIVSGGVSNVLVINCSFNGTDYGIRLKSNDNVGTGSGDGGIVQNLSYYNLKMTNIVHGAIVIYSYYGSGGNAGTPTSVTPFIASTQTIDVTTIPNWRNITISNVTATVANGGVPGIIWARMEVPAANILFSHVTVSAQKSFEIYSARGIQLNDCQVTTPSGVPNYLFFNAQVAFSNTISPATTFLFDGLTTNNFTNRFTFYNTQVALKNTNAFSGDPFTLGGSLFSVTNNLAIAPSAHLDFVLGSSPATITVISNLALSGTINISAGSGFTPGVYTLFKYGQSLATNNLSLGIVPAGFLCSLNTNTPGQVNLQVALPPPSPDIVLNNRDDGNPNCLRYIVFHAPNGDVITFTNTLSGQTILLTNGQIVLNTNLTMDASALTNGIQINGNHAGRIFTVPNGVTVVLNSLTITNGLVINLPGGGIENDGTLTVNNSTFLGNSSADGGGLYNDGTLTVNNSTFYGNVAQSFGGGLSSEDGILLLRQCTIVSNSITSGGGKGGGLSTADSVAATLLNSVIAANTTPNGVKEGGILVPPVAQDYENEDDSITVLNCLIGNSSRSQITNGVNGNLTDLNAQLAPLGNYSGPTLTLPPLSGSPVVDAGNDAAAAGFTTDQRGLPRVSGEQVDIGAAELQLVTDPTPANITSTTWSGTGGSVPFQLSFSGQPGASYRVFSSTDLLLPIADWTFIGFVTEVSPGHFQFTDPTIMVNPEQFYRVRSP
ncbi:MAG TPA: glycosyl hydrolase family 28 protein [Verrucomicrobiae bacterium]|nr:glycosyl hydrolase family 28 protein [Verrucomicrobiae bacterium]